MRMCGPVLLLLAAIVAGCGKPPASVAPVIGRSWSTAEGGKVILKDLLGARATVFLTLDPECPFCQLYAHDMQALSRSYAGQGVNFIGVYTGPYMESGKAAAFAVDAGFTFPQLMDNACLLALALKARATPECFVTDASGTVVYRGAFDDRAVRQGRKKIEAHEHYLDQALAAFLHTGEAQREMTAVGCIVECGE